MIDGLFETLNNISKNDLEIKVTRVHDEYSVYGLEFVNQIVEIIYIRMCRVIEAAQILENRSYRSIINQLKDCWRYITDSEREKETENLEWILKEGMPTSKDSSWNIATEKDFKVMECLNISKPCQNCNSNDSKRCSSNESKKTYKQKNFAKRVDDKCESIEQYLKSLKVDIESKYTSLYKKQLNLN